MSGIIASSQSFNGVNLNEIPNGSYFVGLDSDGTLAIMDNAGNKTSLDPSDYIPVIGTSASTPVSGIIEYSSDLSLSYTSRTLVDKAYVDSNITLNNVLAAGNTTSGSSIIMSDGDLIRGSGNQITLDFGSDAYFAVTTDAGNYLTPYFYVNPAGFYAGGPNASALGLGASSTDLSNDSLTRIISQSQNISVYHLGQSITSNGTNNRMIITDGSSSKGLVYTADYSSNFTYESLVSKRYVDSVSVLSYTFSNGISLSGPNVQLGGTLTQTTSITGSYTFNLGTQLSPLTSIYHYVTNNIDLISGDTSAIATEIYQQTNQAYILATSDGYNSNAAIYVNAATQSITNNGVNNVLQVEDSIAGKGLVYMDDYSGNFTYESLVSKRYADTKQTALTAVNSQTASYGLLLTDIDKLVQMDSGATNSITVPFNASVAFPILTQIPIAQYGTGQTQVVAAGGVTIRSSGGKLKLTGQYSGATLVKIDTNEWYLFGDITT